MTAPKVLWYHRHDAVVDELTEDASAGHSHTGRGGGGGGGGGRMPPATVGMMGCVVMPHGFEPRARRT